MADLVKQYGPVVSILFILIFWMARRIDGLLDRNATIYEEHVKQLTETQKWLLTRLIGPQPSSTEAPTTKDLEALAKKKKEDKK